MEKINNEKRSKYESFFIEKSFDDEKGCIHVPIEFAIDTDVSYFDIDTINYVSDLISNKYPKLKFNGKNRIPENNKEVLFFYQQTP